MGIVVCLTLLATLAVLRPNLFTAAGISPYSRRHRVLVALVGLVVGGWNSLYGLQNLAGFWGVAALISGALQLLAALTIAVEVSMARPLNARLRTAVIWPLALCFLLYAITLIQMNLGYPYLT